MIGKILRVRAGSGSLDTIVLNLLLWRDIWRYLCSCGENIIQTGKYCWRIEAGHIESSGSFHCAAVCDGDKDPFEHIGRYAINCCILSVMLYAGVAKAGKGCQELWQCIADRIHCFCFNNNEK